MSDGRAEYDRATTREQGFPACEGCGHEEKSGQKEYIAHVRVRVHSQDVEDGYDLHDWDDRIEAEIETVDHHNGFEQLSADSKSDLLDALDDLDLQGVAVDG